MRVALVADWSLPRLGGIELHLMALARQLRQRGIEAEIVTSFPGPEVIDGVPIHRIDCLRLPSLELAISPMLVAKLRKAFGRSRFDVIHIHASIVAPTCLAAAHAASQLRLPTIVTFHSVMRTLPRMLRWLASMSALSSRPPILSAVSNRVAGQLRKAFPDREVKILPNGFDYDFWHAPSPRRRGGPFHVVSALRLQPRKRPFALLDILAEARQRVGGPELRLTIAGDGDLRRSVEVQIGRRGLERSINLLGWASPAQLKELYSEADAFLMPSRSEAFCIAALEARAAGLPVVASADTGIADFVRHGSTGMLCRSDEEMAQALAALCMDDRLRDTLSAGDPALARYDWPNLIGEHERLYAERLAASS